MRIRRTSIALAAVAAVAGFVAYNHVSPAEAGPQYAALTLGKNASGVLVGEVCTDRAGDEDARVCSINGFIRKGGTTVTSSRNWNCKGYVAAAIASNGRFEVVWCRQDKNSAATAAMAGCTSAGGGDCSIVLNQLDR